MKRSALLFDFGFRISSNCLAKVYLIIIRPSCVISSSINLEKGHNINSFRLLNRRFFFSNEINPNSTCNVQTLNQILYESNNNIIQLKFLFVQKFLLQVFTTWLARLCFRELRKYSKLFRSKIIQGRKFENILNIYFSNKVTQKVTLSFTNIDILRIDS